jgi:hypothetical protein
MARSSTLVKADIAIRSAVRTFLIADVAATARWFHANLEFRTPGSVPRQEPFAYASLQRGTAEIKLTHHPTPVLLNLRYRSR